MGDVQFAGGAVRGAEGTGGLPGAVGAGADRFSTGMQKSFGKPIGNAAQVKKGQVIFEIGIDKANLELAKKALTRAKTKLPCSCIIEVKENK